MSLDDKLDIIRSPRHQNQRETAVVLSAVEETLRDQRYGETPTAYFAALLALLSQSIAPSGGIVNKELATSVLYLLDLVTPHVPAPLLRSKFSQILTSIAPVLTNHEVEAPLIKSSIGCLESLLVAQDSGAWALPPAQITPRRALAGLLVLASDHRPKVRKRAQDAITHVLKSPPPSPSLDHPAADMCAETVMLTVHDVMTAHGKNKKKKGKGQAQEDHHQPGLMHALQAVKTIAAASGGWPSKKIEPLCQILMNISKSNNDYLTIAAFEVFETMFEGMADEFSSSKFPRLMEAILELRPSQTDSQLLPPWVAVVSRGCHVSAQIDPEDTFRKLPDIFEMISGFLSSSSHNIRISASECLISFLVNCVPSEAIWNPSILDETTLDKVAVLGTSLLGAKYQAAWMESFSVLSALFENLKWRCAIRMDETVSVVGELRSNNSFQGKKQADAVLGKAVRAVGPEAFLNILPFNLAKSGADQPGRAWLLPILRDHVLNTSLAHFKSEFVPLSEAMFQRVIDHGANEKTMEIKIFETLVHQIWALLPGYCTFPLDLTTAFDQEFAELLSNLLYKQTELRSDICKALQMLVESNQEISKACHTANLPRRITKEAAEQNIVHLSEFSGNLLAVLFNVYSETLPQYRGFILPCINAYLSITPDKELLETFSRVTSMLEAALADSTSQAQADKKNQSQPKGEKWPATTHTLMDLIVTLSIYLPRSTFPALFSLTALILSQAADPQLQKKAYKLLPRLATSPIGIEAFKDQDRSRELQSLLLNSASTATPPCRRDRLAAIAVVAEHLWPSSLHFIPSMLSEVIISTKEANEKARSTAFDLLVLMARKMNQGGTISQSKIPHMPQDAPDAKASLEEFFTMVSAGLVGSTPHMVSASITALSRVLYDFHDRLPPVVTKDLIATMDLFLTSANREIVRSVLGFVKVTVITLPESIVKPRLQSLVPGLMSWSREHKARFRSKVKHILERMIRRFGFELVGQYCPEEDRKFINNIRKTKERLKRKKGTNRGNEDDDEAAADQPKRKNRFESEYDRAIYGSDESESTDDDGSQDHSDAERGNRRARGSKTYIVEDSDEPLDLLDRKALAHISSSRPVRGKQAESGQKQKGSKMDADGKLIFGADEDGDDGDPMVIDFKGRDGGGDVEGTVEEGIGAYVDAIKGRDAVQRGRGGRLKFSNKRDRKGEVEEDGEDGGGGGGDDARKSERGGRKSGHNRGRPGGGASQPSSGKGAISARTHVRGNGTGRNASGGRGGRGGGSTGAKSQRRGLGMGKVRAGRVGKGDVKRR